MTKSRELSDTPNKQVARNDLINGNFDIWQRGTSFNFPAPTTAYTSDRWKFIVNATVADNTITRENFNIDQTDVPFSPKFYTRLTVNTTATGSPQPLGPYEDLAQDIENGYTGSFNKNFTISVWVRMNTTRNVEVYYIGVNDLGQDTLFESSTNSFSVTANVWSKLTFTTGPIDHTLASTNLINNEARFGVRISNPSIGETLDIAQTQVEEGIVATDFEILPKEQIISLCERYYEKTYQLEDAPATITSQGRHHIYAHGAAGAVSFSLDFSVRKRVQPTITLYSPFTGTAGVFANNILGDVLTTLSSNGEQGFHTGGVSTFQIISNNYIHYTADAEI